MLPDPSSLTALLAHVQTAEHAVKTALERDNDDELDYEALRNLFFATLCDSLHEQVTGDIVWGTSIEEFDRRGTLPTAGAELHVLVSVDKDDGRLLGGFLACTAMLTPYQDLTDDEAGGLINLCERMLKRSAMTFLFLFSHDSVKVVAGASVVSCPTTHLQDLASWTPTEFFSALLKGFVADPSLTSAREKRRIQVIDSIGADVTVFINAHDVKMRNEKKLPTPRYGVAKTKPKAAKKRQSLSGSATSDESAN